MTGQFPAFAAAVAKRLGQGAVTYRDASFRRDPVALAGEVEQELLDVCA